MTWVDLVIACGGWREKKVCEKFLGDDSGILVIGVQHYGENM